MQAIVCAFLDVGNLDIHIHNFLGRDVEIFGFHHLDFRNKTHNALQFHLQAGGKPLGKLGCILEFVASKGFRHKGAAEDNRKGLGHLLPTRNSGCRRNVVAHNGVRHVCATHHNECKQKPYR